MVDLKRSQIRTIEEAMAYPNGFGYVLDFSDRTMEVNRPGIAGDFNL